jgi:hypothetical protein
LQGRDAAVQGAHQVGPKKIPGSLPGHYSHDDRLAVH